MSQLKDSLKARVAAQPEDEEDGGAFSRDALFARYQQAIAPSAQLCDMKGAGAAALKERMVSCDGGSERAFEQIEAQAKAFDEQTEAQCSGASMSFIHLIQTPYNELLARCNPDEIDPATDAGAACQQRWQGWLDACDSVERMHARMLGDRQEALTELEAQLDEYFSNLPVCIEWQEQERATVSLMVFCEDELEDGEDPVICADTASDDQRDKTHVKVDAVAALLVEDRREQRRLLFRFNPPEDLPSACRDAWEAEVERFAERMNRR